MDVTINPVLIKAKKRDDGSIPVFLRMTKSRSSVFESLGFSVQPSSWNTKKRRVRESAPHAQELNRIIEEKLLFWKSNLLAIPNPDGLSIAKLKQFVLTKPIEHGLEDQMKEYEEQLKRDRRVHEIGKARTLFENLKTYSSQHTRLQKAMDIDARICSDFQMFLKDLGLNNNTIRRRLRTFSAFMDYLRIKGHVKTNPLHEIKKVAEAPTTRIRLSVDQINAIKSLSLAEGTAMWHARNYFLFSFYNGGIRFGDLCRLRWRDLNDDRLIYRMSKTGEEVSFKQEKAPMAILNLYRSHPADSEEYIFPLLKGKVVNDPFHERQLISSLNVITNNNLKRIAKLAGISGPISFHVSRHSFADYARTQGIDLHTLSKLLRHSKLSTTERYLAKFDQRKADEAMTRLFGEEE
jgi:site-specific recombinase XerD